MSKSPELQPSCEGSSKFEDVLVSTSDDTSDACASAVESQADSMQDFITPTSSSFVALQPDEWDKMTERMHSGCPTEEFILLPEVSVSSRNWKTSGLSEGQLSSCPLSGRLSEGPLGASEIDSGKTSGQQPDALGVIKEFQEDKTKDDFNSPSLDVAGPFVSTSVADFTFSGPSHVPLKTSTPAATQHLGSTEYGRMETTPTISTGTKPKTRVLPEIAENPNEKDRSSSANGCNAEVRLPAIDSQSGSEMSCASANVIYMKDTRRSNSQSKPDFCIGGPISKAESNNALLGGTSTFDNISNKPCNEQEPSITSVASTEERPRSPSGVSVSSAASSKRLEWDSAADVGYNRRGSVQSHLSTIERMAIGNCASTLFQQMEPRKSVRVRNIEEKESACICTDGHQTDASISTEDGPSLSHHSGGTVRMSNTTPEEHSSTRLAHNRKSASLNELWLKPELHLDRRSSSHDQMCPQKSHRTSFGGSMVTVREVHTQMQKKARDVTRLAGGGAGEAGGKNSRNSCTSTSMPSSSRGNTPDASPEVTMDVLSQFHRFMDRMADMKRVVSESKMEQRVVRGVLDQLRDWIDYLAKPSTNSTDAFLRVQMSQWLVKAMVANDMGKSDQASISSSTNGSKAQTSKRDSRVNDSRRSYRPSRTTESERLFYIPSETAQSSAKSTQHPVQVSCIGVETFKLMMEEGTQVSPGEILQQEQELHSFYESDRTRISTSTHSGKETDSSLDWRNGKTRSERAYDERTKTVSSSRKHESVERKPSSKESSLEVQKDFLDACKVALEQINKALSEDGLPSAQEISVYDNVSQLLCNRNNRAMPEEIANWLKAVHKEATLLRTMQKDRKERISKFRTYLQWLESHERQLKASLSSTDSCRSSPLPLPPPLPPPPPSHPRPKAPSPKKHSCSSTQTKVSSPKKSSKSSSSSTTARMSTSGSMTLPYSCSRSVSSHRSSSFTPTEVQNGQTRQTHFGQTFPSPVPIVTHVRQSSIAVQTESHLPSVAVQTESHLPELAKKIRNSPLAYFLNYETLRPMKYICPKRQNDVKKIVEENIKRRIEKASGAARKEKKSQILKQVGKKEDELTLQESLRLFRPDYLFSTKKRENKLGLLTSRRMERAVAKRQWVSCTSLGLNVDKSRQAKCEPTRVPKPPRRIFSHAEMRARTESMYQKLPEVLGKVEERKIKEAHQTNRLMAEIYKKKLQERVLKGRVSLAQFSSVISST